MFHIIKKVVPLPNLRLWARFANEATRVYDVTPLQSKWPAFRSLSTIPGLFELVRVDAGGHGIVWNDEIDLASEEVWHNGQPIIEGSDRK